MNQGSSSVCPWAALLTKPDLTPPPDLPPTPPTPPLPTQPFEPPPPPFDIPHYFSTNMSLESSTDSSSRPCNGDQLDQLPPGEEKCSLSATHFFNGFDNEIDQLLNETSQAPSPQVKRMKLDQTGFDEGASTSFTKNDRRMELEAKFKTAPGNKTTAHGGAAKKNMNGSVDEKPQEGRDKLRVFQVLDEYNASDDNEERLGYVSESSISDEEVEALLEEGFHKGSYENEEEETETQKPIQYMEKTSITVEELGHNHFDVLPEGWIKIIHKSGMPVYLHKTSRVCTLSRPYYLGQGSVRKHAVPLSSVPCLQYKRALEKEKEEEQKSVEEGVPPLGLGIAKIETAEENKESQSLQPEAIREYCSSLFRFKFEQRLHFFSWADRRRFAKAKKLERHHQRPTFPAGTKLIKFPIHNLDEGPNAKPKGEWIMNPNGKSYICILHEYVQHALKKQPTYEFRSLENPSSPYAATVVINGMRYGFGTGTSKKQAKLAAAKASLEILIPEMREKIRGDSNYGVNRERKKDDGEGSGDTDSLAIFDEIKIEDPRVAEFCSKTTEPSPYAILLTCLQRNFGTRDMPIKYTVNPLHRQMNEFIMNVGKHTARVVCKNKKDGKQRASQAILQALHPHISSWGSLLRLYGSKSMTSVKEKKQEEQEITMLQSKASLNSPNYAILDKLKEEMSKISASKLERKPIGVFVPPQDYCLPSSGTELNKVDL